MSSSDVGIDILDHLLPTASPWAVLGSNHEPDSPPFDDRRLALLSRVEKIREARPRFGN